MSTDVSEARYRLDPHARFRVLDDEGMFVLQEEGEVLVVNSVGAFIVERLHDGATLEETVHALTERYTVDAKRARKDLSELVRALVEAGAVVER